MGSLCARIFSTSNFVYVGAHTYISIFVELSLLVYQRPKVWASKCNGRRQTTKNERPRFPIESFCGLARFRTIRPYANYLPPYCQHLLAQSFNCQPVPLARLATRTSPAHPPGPFLPSHARTPPAHTESRSPSRSLVPRLEVSFPVSEPKFLLKVYNYMQTRFGESRSPSRRESLLFKAPA